MRLTMLLACLTLLAACGGPDFEMAPLTGPLPDAAAPEAAPSEDAPSIDAGRTDGGADAPDSQLPDDAASSLDAGSDAADAARPCSEAGACGVLELASNQVAPSGLALGPDALFWTTEGSSPDYVGNVMALSLSDPAATPTVLATNQKYPRALTFASGVLYWGSYGDGAIGKWTAATGQSSLGAPNGRVYSLASDATHFYFGMEVEREGGLPGGAVGRCPLKGCSGTPEIVATSDAKIVSIAIDGGALFWSVYSRDIGAIYRLTLDGSSTPRPLAVGQSSPQNIAAFGGFVYWVSPAAGTVARVSGDADGATPTILASNQPTPWGIAVDAGGVYWTTYTRTGQILKLAHGTSAPIVLASDQWNPGHVRVDAEYAYWTTTGDGSIRRVAK